MCCVLSDTMAAFSAPDPRLLPTQTPGARPWESFDPSTSLPSPLLAIHHRVLILSPQMFTMLPAPSNSAPATTISPPGPNSLLPPWALLSPGPLEEGDKGLCSCVSPPREGAFGHGLLRPGLPAHRGAPACWPGCRAPPAPGTPPAWAAGPGGSVAAACRSWPGCQQPR